MHAPLVEERPIRGLVHGDPMIEVIGDQEAVPDEAQIGRRVEQARERAAIPDLENDLARLVDADQSMPVGVGDPRAASGQDLDRPSARIRLRPRPTRLTGGGVRGEQGSVRGEGHRHPAPMGHRMDLGRLAVPGLRIGGAGGAPALVGADEPERPLDVERSHRCRER